MTSAAVPAVDASDHPVPKRRTRAEIAEYAWIGSIVGYSLLRFVVAWGAFSEHGANPWIFGLIDVGTAYPYAKSVAIVVRRIANSEWRALPMPLLVAVTTFFAPYGYLWFAAGEMPSSLRVGMITCISVLGVAAATGVILKARKMRRDAASPAVIDVTEQAPSAASTESADTEVTHSAESVETATNSRVLDVTDELLIVENEPGSVS